MKKKLRLKKPFRIILSIIAIVIIVTLYFPLRSIYKLIDHDYSILSSIEIYKIDLYDEVIALDYSETLDKIVRDSAFDINNYLSYIELDYYDDSSYLVNVNKMLELGYTTSDINIINCKASSEFLETITDEYIYDIAKYLEIDYFKEENYERYLAYFTGDYEETVLYVNIGLDKEYYEDTDVTSEFSVTMLVNKYHGVTEDFEVPNLVQIDSKYSSGDNYLYKEAAEAFENMAKDAESQGYTILANSTYRSYEDQQEIWDTYLNLYGESYNEKYVTKPGYSEHETGLAIDIKSGNSSIFKNSDEYTWTVENCYKYGFIHRYQESKVDITGISSESWHFRYVGVEIATYMYENNLSYEEYYAMFLDD